METSSSVVRTSATTTSSESGTCSSGLSGYSSVSSNSGDSLSPSESTTASTLSGFEYPVGLSPSVINLIGGAEGGVPSPSLISLGGVVSVPTSSRSASKRTRGRTYTSYDIKFKLEAVAYSETHSGVATATKFGVDPKRIRDWRRQKDQLGTFNFDLSPDYTKSPFAPDIMEEGHGQNMDMAPHHHQQHHSDMEIGGHHQRGNMNMTSGENHHDQPVDMGRSQEVPEQIEMLVKIKSPPPSTEPSEDEEEDLMSGDDEDAKIQALVNNLPLVDVSVVGSLNSIGCSGGGPPRTKQQIPLKLKLEALKYLETHSVNATSRKYGVAPKSVRDWRAHKAQIEQTVREELLALEQTEDDGTPTPPRKRIPGAGRKKRGQGSISFSNTSNTSPELPYHIKKKLIVQLEENPNKRHRRTIKLSDKVEIIRLIENGQTQSDVARSLGISQSTVQTIWSNKQDIIQRNMTPKKKRKNLHWKKYSVVDHSLYTWYRQCRETGVPVDGKMLLDKAVEFAEYYKQPDFKPQATRWVDMFKKRHSISDVDRQDRIHAAAVAAMEHHQMHQQQPNHLQQQQHPQHQNNMPHPTSTTSAHDLVPEFDLSSLPGLMTGLYPPDPTNPTGAPPSSAPPLPPPNFNNHIPIVATMPVTTCDAMKYVELVRSWVVATFGDTEETLSNHLNAIENSILKRRMTEMLAPVNMHR